jgi:hypothetical protein
MPPTDLVTIGFQDPVLRLKMPRRHSSIAACGQGCIPGLAMAVSPQVHSFGYCSNQ